MFTLNKKLSLVILLIAVFFIISKSAKLIEINRGRLPIFWNNCGN
jgi:hypothetical protein